MEFFTFLALMVYLVLGFIMYVNDVFDTESATLVPLITYTLIGGVVISLRVFRLSAAILLEEVESALPGLIDWIGRAAEAVWNFIVSIAKTIKEGIVELARSF